MRLRIDALADEMVELARGFEPARVSGDDADVIAEAARVIARAASSIEARAVARAAEANAWKRAGAKSAEEWLAKKSGTSRARAKKKLKLGEQLDRHENLRNRFTSGDVSEEQAEIVGGAADENPDAEDDLLNAAEEESLAGLRKKAAQAKAAVSDEEERQAKLHEERYGSGGTDEDGAYRFGGRLSAFQGGIFDTIWQRFRDQVAAEVDAGGSLAGLGLPDVTMHILIDDTARQRGYVVKGETCEIDGVAREAGAERLPSVSIRPGSPRSAAHAFAGQWHRGCWLDCVSS